MKKRLFTLILLAGLMFTAAGFLQTAHAQSRSLLDQGLLWQDDLFIRNHHYRPIMVDDYIYVAGRYGIYLYKLEGNDIVPCDTLPGNTITEGKDFFVLDSLVIWRSSRLYIAERRGDRLHRIYEGIPDWNWGNDCIFSSDSLLLLGGTLISFHDPYNPQITWQTDELRFDNNTIFHEGHLISINENWHPEVKVFDVSDPWQPVLVDSLYMNNPVQQNNWRPKAIGDVIAIPERDQIRFFHLNDAFEVDNVYAWESDEYFNNWDNIEVLRDSLFISFNRIRAGQSPLAAIFDPDEYLQGICIELVELDEDWTGWSTVSYEYPYSASGNKFLISSTNTTDSRLFDFTCLETPTMAMAIDRDAVYTYGGGLYDLNGDYLLKEEGGHLVLYNLTVSSTPREIARTRNAPGAAVASFSVLDSSVIVSGSDQDTNEYGLYYFIIQEDGDLHCHRIYSTSEVPTCEQNNIDLFEYEDDLYEVTYWDNTVYVNRFAPHRVVVVATLQVGGGGVNNLIVNDLGIFCTVGNGISPLVWCLYDPETESLSHQTQLNYSHPVQDTDNLCSGDEWIGAGSTLFRCIDGELEMEHVFLNQNGTQCDGVICAVGNGRIVIQKTDTNSPTFFIFPLDEDGVVLGDTLGIVHDVTGNYSFTRNNIWAENTNALMRFRFNDMECASDEHSFFEHELPSEMSLAAPWPNPFNSETRIQYRLPEGGMVRLRVFDILGREVLRLRDGVQPAGQHEARWDGTTRDGMAVVSGVYFVQLECEGRLAVQKVLLVR